MPAMDDTLRNEVTELLSLSMDITRHGGTFDVHTKENISTYTPGRFPSLAHFVATVILQETRGTLRGVDLEVVVPERGWKSLFDGFAKGVNANNIFSGRKRLGPPTHACRILATGNEQLYALDCGGTYATLFMQTS
jgi:hypothetical protein